MENSRSIDSVLGGVLQLIADGKLDAQLQEIVAKTIPVAVQNPTELPTEEVING